MGLWRIGFGLYGEEETWIFDRGMKHEWPAASDIPPCDVCSGRLVRRKYYFKGKDDEDYSGYRYNLTHYGKIHDRQTPQAEQRLGERRKAS